MSGARAMKNWWPIYLLGVGVLLLVGSVIFAGLMVGIPGPDDPPAEVARQGRLGNVALFGFLAGVLLSFTGLIAGLVSIIRSARRLRRALASTANEVVDSKKGSE